MENIFENFTVGILRLNKLVQRIKVYEMKEYNLKAIHVMCVYYLSSREGGLTASDLVKLTLEDKAAISRALNAMRSRGFVTYDINKHNAPVKLTEEGKKLSKFIAERSARAVEAGSAEMSDEERALFYNTLTTVAENLNDYYKKITGRTATESEED